MNNATTMMMVWTTWEQWWWFWIAVLRVSWSYMIQRGITPKRSLRKRLWRVSLGESCHGLHTTSFLISWQQECAHRNDLSDHHKSSQSDGYLLNYVRKKLSFAFRGALLVLCFSKLKCLAWFDASSHRFDKIRVPSIDYLSAQQIRIYLLTKRECLCWTK